LGHKQGSKLNRSTIEALFREVSSLVDPQANIFISMFCWSGGESQFILESLISFGIVAHTQVSVCVTAYKIIRCNGSQITDTVAMLAVLGRRHHDPNHNKSEVV
jgi:hypothetical protein